MPRAPRTMEARVEFNLRLDKALEAAAAGLDEKMSSVESEIVSTAKRLAPKSSGEMASTIRVESKGAMTKVIKEDSPGFFQEFGTVRHGASPHIIPGVMQGKHKVMKEAERDGIFKGGRVPRDLAL